MRWRDAGDSGGGSAAGGSGTLNEAPLYRLLKIILRSSATVSIEADDSHFRLTLSAVGALTRAERTVLEGAAQVDRITLSGRELSFYSNRGDRTAVTMPGITTANEGSDLEVDTVEKLNFTGAGVKATREIGSNETIVNIPGGVGDKIATYRFPASTDPPQPYPVGRDPIPGTWTVDSNDAERYQLTDNNNSLRIKRDLPDTLLGFRGVVKVGSATVSTFLVPWTLVVAPSSTSANDNVHVEQGYYITIPYDTQSHSVLLVVQRQAVNTHGDAIFFRGCNNVIPAGVVTVELYEWIA